MLALAFIEKVATPDSDNNTDICKVLKSQQSLQNLWQLLRWLCKQLVKVI